MGSSEDQPRTILGQFGRRKLCGDREGLFGAALEDEAGGDVGAAVVVLFAARQPQVQRVIVKRAVLIALQVQDKKWNFTQSVSSHILTPRQQLPNSAFTDLLGAQIHF